MSETAAMIVSSFLCPPPPLLCPSVFMTTKTFASGCLMRRIQSSSENAISRACVDPNAVFVVRTAVDT